MITIYIVIDQWRRDKKEERLEEDFYVRKRTGLYSTKPLYILIWIVNSSTERCLEMNLKKGITVTQTPF